MTNLRPRRDKHPARSARILSTGIAVASTLGVSTALTLSAQATTQNTPVDGQVATSETAPQEVSAQAVAPSSPGAATPAPAAEIPVTISVAAPNVPSTPQVIDIPFPAAPQGGWTAPATSGSK